MYIYIYIYICVCICMYVCIYVFVSIYIFHTLPEYMNSLSYLYSNSVYSFIQTYIMTFKTLATRMMIFNVMFFK